MAEGKTTRKNLGFLGQGFKHSYQGASRSTWQKDFDRTSDRIGRVVKAGVGYLIETPETRGLAEFLITKKRRGFVEQSGYCR